MLENFEYKQEKSELIERVATLKPQFKDRTEALAFYCQKLEKISSAHGKTVDDFLALAESQTTQNPDLMEALSLAKTIKGLKSIG